MSNITASPRRVRTVTAASLAHRAEAERWRAALLEARADAERYRQQSAMGEALARQPPAASPPPQQQQQHKRGNPTLSRGLGPPRASRTPRSFHGVAPIDSPVDEGATPIDPAGDAALMDALMDRIVLTRHWDYIMDARQDAHGTS